MSIENSEKVGQNEDTVKAIKYLTFDSGGCERKIPSQNNWSVKTFTRKITEKAE